MKVRRSSSDDVLVLPGGGCAGVLKLSDLALRSDFTLGPLSISPARRKIEGPAGETQVEPLVMQTFLLLLDSGGAVVTRNELFDQCWGGVAVGDDSLNRAIAGVRRIAAETGPGLFEIETIPRTGYRLIMSGAADAEPLLIKRSAGGAQKVPRRRILLAAGGGVVALAGAGLWSLERNRGDARFNALMERADNDFSKGTQNGDQTVRTLQQALALDPHSARAWGLLAFLKAFFAESAARDQSARMVDDAERAATRAFAIDPKEPNALTAIAIIQSSIDGWAKFDQRLRDVLAIDPKNARAMSLMTVFVQGAGLNRESWEWNERALAIEPLSLLHLPRRALKLWILDRVPQADRVIDRVRDLWPLDEWSFFVRFLIFALTDRPRAALAMIDGNEAKFGPPAAASMWRTSLQALEYPSAANKTDATKAVLDAATLAPGLAAQGVMILAALGEVDAAFELTNGFLRSRGRILIREHKESRRNLNDPGWRWTPWLFTPPTAVMRADPRFLPLCAEIGLTDYWAARRVRPDYELAGR